MLPGHPGKSPGSPRPGTRSPQGHQRWARPRHPARSGRSGPRSAEPWPASRPHLGLQSTNPGSSSRQSTSASAAMASPFHAATTLSSRAGATRWFRLARRISLTRAKRPVSSGSASSRSTERPASKRAGLGDAEHLRRVPPVGRTECVGQFRGGPGVEEAPPRRRWSASSAEAKPPSAVPRPAIIQAQVSRATRSGQRRAGAPPQVRVYPGEQGVVVEHLLEMWARPTPRPPSSARIPRLLVVHAAAGHRTGGEGGHRQRRLAGLRGPARSAGAGTPAPIEGGNFGAPPKPPRTAS